MYTLMRVKDFDAASDLPAVLLDRLWPRGVRKEHLQEVSWEKAATPSSASTTNTDAHTGSRAAMKKPSSIAMPSPKELTMLSPK